MDLTEQLVVWKRARYLQDHLALTPEICRLLVERDIFTPDMMHAIQSKDYGCERVLMMLMLLGTHGDNIFPKFLQVLTDCHLPKVVEELTRTEKHVKFGEMLPPSFSYFLDLSDFLKKYSHISMKLGEEGKHLLQLYIEGQVEMAHRKLEETIRILTREKIDLKALVESMEEGAKIAEEQQQVAAEKDNQAQEQIENLTTRVRELEKLNKEHREELRRLKHLGKQQNDLNDYLEKEYNEFIPEEMKDTNVERQENNLALGDINPTDILKIRLLESKINVQLLKLDLTKTSIKHVEGEEARVQRLMETTQTPKGTLPISTTGGAFQDDLQDFSGEMATIREQLEQQLKDGEDDLLAKQQELVLLGEHNVSTVIKTDTYTDLVAKLEGVIENMRVAQSIKITEIGEYHSKECEQYIRTMDGMNQKHRDDIERLRARIRQKMSEIHRREHLHRRMRHQIGIIARYHAKNMNSSVPVDVCRKIVRGIIRETRKLREIAEGTDEQQRELAEIAEQQQQQQQQQQQSGTNPENQDNTKNKENTSPKPKEKKKKKKKKKHAEALADDRLRYIVEKVGDDWRNLGVCLGISQNRMDMLEMDNGGYPERVPMAMMRAWRDEQDGKVVELMEALEDIGREDLVGVAIPAMYLREPRRPKSEFSLADEPSSVLRPKSMVSLGDDSGVDSISPFLAGFAHPRLPDIPKSDNEATKNEDEDEEDDEKAEEDDAEGDEDADGEGDEDDAT